MSGAGVDDCLFCAIASGAREAHRVLEEDDLVAFLDHRPLFPGHTLIVPRVHFETLADLPDDLLPVLFAAARRLSIAVETGLAAKGSFVAMNNRVSQSVPHFHVHVVPRRPKDGLRGFFWPRQRYRDEQQIDETVRALREALEGI